MPAVTVTAVESTDLFTGTEAAPRQVLRVTVDGPPGAVTVTGPGVRGEAAGTGVLEVPLDVTTPVPGERRPVTVTAGRSTVRAELEVAEPGWTMFMVSHFHYDPVWWNTQAAYTSPWELLSGDATTRPLWERNGFALVDAHLELALRDPVYTFVLAEVDYLKPYFDQHPERRAQLRLLLERGRVELVGGTYNEPNTNLTGAETTIRNLVLGIGYQRDILGGDPQTAWQLDVFGHDPQFPGYLAAAGLTGSAWARGPFHQWGPIQKNFRAAKDDATVMQFDSEFEWIAPSGAGVLTHYMPHHYSAGWWMDSAPDLAAAEQAVYELYRKLKPVGATRNLLLPVGTDYTPPNKWVTEIHRSWAARYVWPRFVCGTPRDFLTAVRAELAATGRRPSPQTRDMNPVYTGKDVSYIDTKQAQRAAETAALDAERFAVLAALQGLGRYPHEALDKVWRHLAYGAHHDAITGSESDQVYLDLLGGWREAHDLAAEVRDASLGALTDAVATGPARSVAVVNPLSFERSEVVSLRLPDGLGPVHVVDEGGRPLPCAVDRGTLHFRADRVPALGWRTFALADGPADPLWTPAEGLSAENGRYRVIADPLRGGALSSVQDRLDGRELLRAGRTGNELRVYREYPQHPDFGEGPWHLVPSGPVIGSADAPATVRRETGPLGERLVAEGRVDGIGYRQTVTLWAGADRIDFRTTVTDHASADRLLRVRFPVDLPGGLPVSEVAGAVVGRGFALPDVDSAEAPWTLDNPANTWFGLGSTARVTLTDPSGRPLGDRALGVAEIIVPTAEQAADARALVVALARVGVTATTAAADRARYGWLDVDSNLPDFRILLGGPEHNPATSELLDRAGSEHAAALARDGRVWVPAEKPLQEVWQPCADLRDLRALPALVLGAVPGARPLRPSPPTESADAAGAALPVPVPSAGPMPAAGPLDIAALADALTEELATARISAPCVGELPAGERLSDRTAALLTQGLPGFAVDATGALHLSLMRACTGWPSGVWIDPPRRTLPDGASFQLQHWTHDFHYALVGGDGDWRAHRLPSRGQEFNHPLHTRLLPAGRPGPLPATCSWLRVAPEREVLLGALKPTGNPLAHGSAARPDPAAGLTLRLLDATGLGRTATLDGALHLADLHTADLLEQPIHPAPDLTLTGSQVATFTARPATGPTTPGSASPATAAVRTTSSSLAESASPAESAPPAASIPPVLGPVAERAQPVHSRYWLHNRGPAPLGYLPVSVGLSPGLARTTGEPVELSAVLASHLVDTAVEGTVELLVPDGWQATPRRRPYRLDASGHLRFPVAVTPPADAQPGLYFLTLRTEHAGQQIEDVATLAVGDFPAVLPALLPADGGTPEDWSAAQGTRADSGRDTGLTVTVSADALNAAPGGRAALGVTLHNRTRDGIRGEIQLVSPWGSWDAVAEPVRGFAVPAGGELTVPFEFAPPADADPGSSWALAKVMWFGRCQYAPTVGLVVGS